MHHLSRAAGLLLGLLLASGAQARAPMETNQLVDDSGTPIGTTANPLFTAFGSSALTVNQGAPGPAWPVLVGQFNTSLPTLASGATGYLAVDNAGRLLLAPASSVAVSNFPATQAVTGTVNLGAGSAAIGTVGVTSLPSLPAGANAIGSVSVSNLPATQAVSWSGQSVGLTGALPAGSNTIGSVNVLGGNTTALKTDGSATVQPITATALPLPSGAAIAAKQPAIGTAGAPSTDVLTVQGAASMTALKVDGSGVTQPVSGTVGVSNFPASQAVTNAGTFAVQNTAAVVGGNAVAVKVDGSATTQPITAASLPLPSGAATSSNQASEIAALGATSDAAYAGSGTASIIAALKGVYAATLAPLAAGSNTIGSIANISGTVSLPTNAATLTAQTAVQSAPGTSASTAQGVQGVTGGVPVTVAAASGVTRSRLSCTLPAYASGGNIVCTNEAGSQTTTACAANTACLVSAANAARKTAAATVRTAGVTCDLGYTSTVAPGNASGIDGPGATTGAQGGSVTETPAHTGTYYAACGAAATLVFVQGQ
ncbi:hypothetical protein [Methylobacterium sp. JK268]